MMSKLLSNEPMTHKKHNQYGAGRGTGFFVLSALLIVIVGGVFIPIRQGVELSFAQQSCYIDSQSFDLKWLHSVEKQWWAESYQIEADHLLLSDAYLQTFGAGTPSTEAVAQNDRQDYAGYVRYQINTRLPHLDWMVSSNIQAVIIVNDKNAHQVTTPNQGRTLPVFKWVSDYTNIHIAPKRLSLGTLLLKEPCNDHYPL